MASNPIDPDHAIDQHHQATGEWSCYVCKLPLKGSFMRPVIPWEHKPAPPAKLDSTPTPTLDKEGS